jgi:flagellar protein FliO/FliZ
MQDTSQLILVIAAGLFVIGLIALAAWSFRAFFSNSGGGPSFLRTRERRLGVVESFSIDAKRKMLLIRRDDKEHLLIVGGPVDVLVETGIEGRRPLEHPLEDVVIDQRERRPLQQPPQDNFRAVSPPFTSNDPNQTRG